MKSRKVRRSSFSPRAGRWWRWREGAASRMRGRIGGVRSTETPLTRPPDGGHPLPASGAREGQTPSPPSSVAAALCSRVPTGAIRATGRLKYWSLQIVGRRYRRRRAALQYPRTYSRSFPPLALRATPGLESAEARSAKAESGNPALTSLNLGTGTPHSRGRTDKPVLAVCRFLATPAADLSLLTAAARPPRSARLRDCKLNMITPPPPRRRRHPCQALRRRQSPRRSARNWPAPAPRSWRRRRDCP